MLFLSRLQFSSFIRTGIAYFKGNRAISSTFLTSVLAQVVRPLISLLLTPILLNYLGVEGIGVWLIVLSFMGLIGFLTNGLGVAVVTSLQSKKDDRQVNSESQVVASAFLVALMGCLATIAIFLPLAFLVDWSSVLNVRGIYGGVSLKITLVTLVILIGFGVLTSVPRHVFYGLNRGYLANAIDILSVIFGAVLTVVFVSQERSMPVLLCGFIGVQIFCQISLGLHFMAKHDLVRPSFQLVKTRNLFSLVKVSLQMGSVQLGLALSRHLDVFLVSVFVGPLAAAGYGLSQRLFSIPLLVFQSLNQTLLPKYSNEYSAGETTQVLKLYKHLVVFVFTISIILALTIYVGFDTLFLLWLGDRSTEVPIDEMMILGMAVWLIMQPLADSAETILKAFREFGLITRLTILMAIMNLGISVLLLNTLGQSGAVWGTVITVFFCLLIPYVFAIRSFSGSESKNDVN